MNLVSYFRGFAKITTDNGGQK